MRQNLRSGRERGRTANRRNPGRPIGFLWAVGSQVPRSPVQYAAARHRLSEEAEDVAQEAFVQAFVKLSSFRRNSAFYTWLYRIAFNTSISRSRRKRPELSVDRAREEAGVEPMDNLEEPTDRLLRQERAEQVQQALTALSEEHRAVLVLREMDGLCYDEIADVLDMPVGTVRSRLHRARLHMREELEEILGENLA